MRCRGSEGLQKARDVFYHGPVAQQIADSVARVGGIMSTDDLAAYKSQFDSPVKTTFHGYEIYGQNTWTQGPVLMQTLNMLENYDLKSMGHNSPAYIHTVAEAVKLSFGDREAHYGDPDFSTIPIDGLLSKEYAAERARLIDLETAYPAQPEAGDPWRYSSRSRSGNGARGNGLPEPSDPATADASAREGTTHVSAMDQYGNMVCGTISGGAFAKSVFFPELGCALSTRIEMFNCEEGHPERGRTWEAPAHHAGQLHHLQGRPAGDDRRMPRRGQPGPGQRAADAERHPLRDGPAAGGGSASLRHAEQRQLLLPARPIIPGAWTWSRPFPRPLPSTSGRCGHRIARAVDCGMGGHGVGARLADGLHEHRRRPATGLLRHGAVSVRRKHLATISKQVNCCPSVLSSLPFHPHPNPPP